VPSSKVPSLALIVVPVPFTPAVSMKYSAPATLLNASVSVAETVGGELVGDALTPAFDVTGPCVSYVTTLSVDVDAVLVSPKEFIAAPAGIDALTVPSFVMPETVTV